jgi:hypothetical protein
VLAYTSLLKGLIVAEVGLPSRRVSFGCGNGNDDGGEVVVMIIVFLGQSGVREAGEHGAFVQTMSVLTGDAYWEVQ